MDNSIKIAKSIVESGLLIKCVSEKIKHEAKKTKMRIYWMLLLTLDASLPRNLLAGVGTIRAGYDN